MIVLVEIGLIAIANICITTSSNLDQYNACIYKYRDCSTKDKCSNVIKKDVIKYYLKKEENND